MLTVLFWNIGGLERAQVCARLAHHYQVTVLCLAECARPTSILRALNPVGSPAQYYYHRPRNCRVTVFSTLPVPSLPVIEENTHYSIRRLVHLASPELILVSMHFPSKLRMKDEEQERILRQFAEQIGETERQASHARTLLIGDLNAHPYQRGVFSADGLHGVPTRAIALRRQRTVAKQSYKMLYNPMWRFFGDGSNGPPGTYYRWRAEHDCAFWYMFDQVFLRPDLLPYFSDPDIEILTTDGKDSFLRSDGTPNRDVASDHLPVLIRLNYPGF
jgi:exonuclease III